MRTAAFGATLMIALAACSTTSTKQTDDSYMQPNQLMATEISRRIEQIPYLHREELVDNLLWLAQTGEQSIPALLQGLKHENTKVRSSAAWVLGRIRDRRTIPNLQAAVNDREPTVRFECARSLVLLGDLANSPVLIEGLDSDRKEVRYLCHEALKTATGHDFGYDHLAANVDDLRGSVLRWRQWWGEYSGDNQYAMSYQQRYNLGMPAAPGGEVKPQQEPKPVPKPQPPADGEEPITVPPATPEAQPTQAPPTQTQPKKGEAKEIEIEPAKPQSGSTPVILPIVPVKPPSGSGADDGIQISNPKPVKPAGDQPQGPGGALPPGIVPVSPTPSGTPAPKPTGTNGGQ